MNNIQNIIISIFILVLIIKLCNIYIFKKRINRIIKNININHKILDFGCGSCCYTKYLKDLGYNITGIDVINEGTCLKPNIYNGKKIPYNDNYFDVVICSFVLHHIPDTFLALKECSRKLKSGAPFLLYLYYRFDNKPKSYYLLWKISDLARNIICRLPFPLKLLITQLVAVFIYFPLARSALILEKLGLDVSNFPLTWYRNEPFYILRTDALDRFGTRLEQRFTKDEISNMLSEAGFQNFKFSDKEPYWTVLSYKK